MRSINQYLAQTLKAIRQRKGWSLDRTAKATGVSKAMLGQIERGESSPTVAVLWKIASGLQTPLSTFIEPTPSEQGSILFRSADQLRSKTASDDMLIAPLFPFDKRYGFEMYELTLLPGYERVSEPHEEGVTEHLIVLSGSMDVLLDGEWHHLEAKGAVKFPGDRTHGYRNLSNESTVFHNVIHYALKCQPTE